MIITCIFIVIGCIIAIGIVVRIYLFNTKKGVGGSHLDKVVDVTGLYQENNRPRYHFTPLKNWMNDPNGLIYYQGEYHLFFQYNPKDNGWGHMSWGHAVSTNLIDWKEIAIAIPEDSFGMKFSGSAVIDYQNTANFKSVFNEDVMIAIFTTGGYSILQEQTIAYSHDYGRTFQLYDKNPVIPNILRKPDFRDPKVFWYTNKWVMLVTAGNTLEFYSSTNLKQWNFMSRFNDKNSETIYECPDIWKTVVNNQTKWVLTVMKGKSKLFLLIIIKIY